MEIHNLMATLLVIAAPAPAMAQPDGMADNTRMGRVDTVYVRVATAFYVQKSLLRNSDKQELWVDVRPATSLSGDAASELFRAPADVVIERGDLVITRSGDPTARTTNLLSEVSRVTRLVAKHDTLMAMTFGLSNSNLAVDLFTEPQASRAPLQPAATGTAPR